MTIPQPKTTPKYCKRQKPHVLQENLYFKTVLKTMDDFVVMHEFHETIKKCTYISLY